MAVEEFGKAVFRIEVTSEAELRSAMERNERVIDASTQNMAQDFNRVSVASADMGDEAASAGQIFGVFGAQTAALGGSVALLGGRVASLGSAFSSLGKAVFGLPGILLGIAAGVGLLINRMGAAAAKTREAKEELEGFVAAQQDLQTKLAGQLVAGAERLTVLTTAADPISIATAASKLEADRRIRELDALAAQEIELGREVATLQREREDRERSQRGPFATDTQRQRLRDPNVTARLLAADQLLGEKANTLKLVRERMEQLRDIQTASEERLQQSLATIRDKARREQLDKDRQQAAKIAEARRQALEGVLAKAQATPFGRVFTTALDVLRERREQTDLKNVLGGLKAFFPGISGLVDEVSQRLGIPQPSVLPGGGTSAVALSAFVGSGAGRPGVSVSGDPVQAERLKLARENVALMKRNVEANEAVARQRQGARP